MSRPPQPMTWTLALRDEPMWRDMGCPTMGSALRRIKDLEARVLRLTLEMESGCSGATENASTTCHAQSFASGCLSGGIET